MFECWRARRAALAGLTGDRLDAAENIPTVHADRA